MDFTASGAMTITHVAASANSVKNIYTMDWNPASGTPGTGFGVGLKYQGKSSTTASQDMALINAEWFVATHASRQADIVAKVYDTAAREVWRGRASGTAPMLGVLGATPQARQSMAALTNNVTSGGTNDQIDDWTDLTTYATDAAAIRNAIYQLARKLKQLSDGERLFGWYI
jgi:hypothetical protein